MNDLLEMQDVAAVGQRLREAGLGYRADQLVGAVKRRQQQQLAGPAMPAQERPDRRFGRSLGPPPDVGGGYQLVPAFTHGSGLSDLRSGVVTTLLEKRRMHDRDSSPLFREAAPRCMGVNPLLH